MSNKTALYTAMVASMAPGIVHSIPSLKPARGERPCLNCGEPHRKSNSFCSTECCKKFKDQP